MTTLRPTIRARRNPSRQAITASIAFQARPQEFDLLDRQSWMAMRLGIALPIVHGPSTRMELIRHEIISRGLADHRASSTKLETWGELFERVHGEALE